MQRSSCWETNYSLFTILSALKTFWIGSSLLIASVMVLLYRSFNFQTWSGHRFCLVSMWQEVAWWPWTWRFNVWTGDRILVRGLKGIQIEAQSFFILSLGFCLSSTMTMMMPLRIMSVRFAINNSMSCIDWKLTFTLITDNMIFSVLNVIGLQEVSTMYINILSKNILKCHLIVKNAIL